MKKVIITGSTGMVGKGVLLECLDDDQIEKVLVINRSSLEMQHPKLEEILLDDFTKIDNIKDKLKAYDGCFFCMGISSIGLTEGQYSSVTYNTVQAFVDTLFAVNSNMVFNYVSGKGTDSSEKGKSMWARVKGKTENYILNKGFADAYMFRPGAIVPERGITSKTNWYSWLYVILKPFFGIMKKSKNITTTTRIGTAMINTLFHKQALKHLENKDINLLSAIKS